MVIPTFIVASGLKITFVHVSGEVSNNIQRKREIFDTQIEESLVVAYAGLRWLHSDRHNHVCVCVCVCVWGGGGGGVVGEVSARGKRAAINLKSTL